MWTFTTNSKSCCFSIIPSRFITISLRGYGSLVSSLSVPVWLQGTTFAVPLKTWKCHHSDLTKSFTAQPLHQSRLEPPYRPQACHACNTFLWTPAWVPILSWERGERKQRSSNSEVLTVLPIGFLASFLFFVYSCFLRFYLWVNHTVFVFLGLTYFT